MSHEHEVNETIFLETLDSFLRELTKIKTRQQTLVKEINGLVERSQAIDQIEQEVETHNQELTQLTQQIDEIIKKISEFKLLCRAPAPISKEKFSTAGIEKFRRQGLARTEQETPSSVVASTKSPIIILNTLDDHIKMFMQKAEWGDTQRQEEEKYSIDYCKSRLAFVRNVAVKQKLDMLNIHGDTQSLTLLFSDEKTYNFISKSLATSLSQRSILSFQDLDSKLASCAIQINQMLIAKNEQETTDALAKFKDAREILQRKIAAVEKSYQPVLDELNKNINLLREIKKHIKASDANAVQHLDTLIGELTLKLGKFYKQKQIYTELYAQLDPSNVSDDIATIKPLIARAHSAQRVRDIISKLFPNMRGVDKLTTPISEAFSKLTDTKNILNAYLAGRFRSYKFFAYISHDQRQKYVDRLIDAAAKYLANPNDITTENLQTVLREGFTDPQYKPRKVGDYNKTLQYSLVVVADKLGQNQLIPEDIRTRYEAEKKRHEPQPSSHSNK